MKIFITTLAMLFSIITYAQEIDVDVEDGIDMTQVAKGSVYPEDIADAVTEGISDPREKAEAIFEWIAKNIRYEVKMYDDFKTGERDKVRGKRIKRSEMEEHNADKVTRTLKKRNGICEDYALVYKAIAEEANLEVRILKGWIRNDPSKLRSTGMKHKWCSVKIGDEWLHLDPTWAAGFVDEHNDFVFDYEETSYLFPDKAQMKYTHFPKDDKGWIRDSMFMATKEEFKAQPIVGKGFFLNKVTKLSPNATLINVKRGETFTFAFESDTELSKASVYLPKLDESHTVKHVQVGNRHNIRVDIKDTYKSGPIHIKADGELIAVYKMTVTK